MELSFEEKPSDHIEDLHKLKFQTNFDVNLATSPGGTGNTVFSLSFTTHPGQIDIISCYSFSLRRSVKS